MNNTGMNTMGNPARYTIAECDGDFVGGYYGT